MILSHTAAFNSGICAEFMKGRFETITENKGSFTIVSFPDAGSINLMPFPVFRLNTSEVKIFINRPIFSGENIAIAAT